jgi:SAM-dependent MidA family methyltransferase
MQTNANNDITSTLKQEIQAAGVLSLARFMEIALYCPKIGYYEHPERVIGRSGDFYTSVSTGPFFGELLAIQFAEWLDQTAGPAISPGVHGIDAEGLPMRPLHLVEAGAHDGQLAFDILSWFSLSRADLFQRLEYSIIEPSPTRQERQRRKLEKFAGQVRWFDTLPQAGQGATPEGSGVTGIIFSNELLDAFPAHRLSWDASTQTWCELGVGWSEGGFAWVKMDGKPEVVNLKEWVAPEILPALPDGFIMDVSPAATAWWEEAASVMRAGKLMTIDYGLTEEEFFTPQHATGTLRAYHRHHQADPLGNPGEQDLTTHVHFTQLQRAGERAGLHSEGLFSQGQFLVRIAEKIPSPQWSPAQIRQFQTLVHPEFLGRKFRVLVQTAKSCQ